MQEINDQEPEDQEEEKDNVRQIQLPNGATLLVQKQLKGPRIIFWTKGLSIGADVLEENPFEYGTNEWANEEIRMYEQALEIDLKIHTDFIKDCLLNQATS